MANKERVQLLVDGLRSGKFRQGQMRLRYGDVFCCLGVACEIYRMETGKGEWKESHPGTQRFTLSDESSDMALLGTVRDWYGFDDTNPSIGESESAMSRER